MTTEIEGMVQFPDHFLAAGWHCRWGKNRAVSFHQDLLYLSAFHMKKRNNFVTKKSS